MVDDPTMTGSDVIVVGGGHAGCEAAVAAARLGAATLLLTIDLDAIGLMPCNPSLGGPGKGHLVRELAAMGGVMPVVADDTLLQVKWLNTSRGPSVRARRAQIDRRAYQRRMLRALFAEPRLTVRQAMVTDVLLRGGRVAGVRTETGVEIRAPCVVLATGTYLDARIIVGRQSRPGGPHQQRAAVALAASLAAAGIGLRRLQTATPPRIRRDSADLTVLRALPGDPGLGGFTWEHRWRPPVDPLPCHLTHTTAATIDCVRRHLDESPLRIGNIVDDGPKHCPSIDRKVMRFPAMTEHHIFLEPTGRDDGEIYLQGLTTSLPPAVQEELVRSVPGLARAQILRYGYAIEYSALAAGTFTKTMQHRQVPGLFSAGQINGTSGYEEAAAQGFLAGINAARWVRGAAPVTVSRADGYLGVLADDLCRWDHPEPYRMVPSHAEFRLSLREDLAEVRLMPQACSIGLVSAERWAAVMAWWRPVADELAALERITVTPTPAVLELLAARGAGGLGKPVSLATLLERPGLAEHDLAVLAPGHALPFAPGEQRDLLWSLLATRGYVNREVPARERARRLEQLRLPLPDDWPGFAHPALASIRHLFDPALADDVYQLARKRCLSDESLAMLIAPGGCGGPSSVSAKPG